MATETHPFYKLSELIDTFNENRNRMTAQELQDLRENISLNLFYLSDSVS